MLSNRSCLSSTVVPELSSPATFPFGERQYAAEDPDGHQWRFTQWVGDVHPSEWGGEAGQLEIQANL